MIWTDETYRIHGFEVESIPRGSTKHIEESLECYDPEDRAVIMEAFTDCCKNGKSYDIVFPLTTLQGESKWIRTKAEAIYKDNHIVKVMGNIADITDLKKAEISAMELRKSIVHS
jgi:PAS domain S-box-containing protein